MITGTAKNRRVIRRIRLTIRNVYLRALSRKPQFLNFRAKSGKLEFKRYALSMVNPIRNQGFRIILFRMSLLCYKRIKGSERINKVLAGVGRPIKEEVWF